MCLAVQQTSISMTLWNYIAQDSVDAADRLTAKLLDSFETLARHPGLGNKREDLTNYPVLFWPVGSYLVTEASVVQ